MTNCNIFHAEALVEELARAGLQHVCLAPGSRNTPLVFAFARYAEAHPELRVTSHLDERSAGFFALGTAIATGAPAAVVCTSGSAAANFFPAIVEAYQSRVPLIVITADRPPELHYSGANQTIDQIKMFGGYTLWSVDLALPEAAPSALVTRNLRTTAARAVAIASGAANDARKGVVHLNVPFRPPLEPTPVAEDMTTPRPDAMPRAENAPFTVFAASAVKPSDEVAQMAADLINGNPRGAIVCGPRSPGGEFCPLVSALAQQTGYPVFADGVSGLRFGAPDVLGGYDTFLGGDHGLPKAEIVIRFGDVPTSNTLNQYLDSSAPPVVIHVRGHGVWADDSHRVSHFIHADEAEFVRAVLPRLTLRESDWALPFRAVEAGWWQAVDEGLAAGDYFDGAALYDIQDLIPAGATLFVGNSLTVRNLDQFGKPTAKPIVAYASRGASGIDGNISTALGIGYARPGAPLVLVVGDITFYHDMNGLLAIQRAGVPVTIVLMNNDGGGIFQRLPVSKFEPEFTRYFVTPHGLDFKHAATLYGLEYVRVDERAAFRKAFAASLKNGGARLIEVRTDGANDLTRRREIMAAYRARMHVGV